MTEAERLRQQAEHALRLARAVSDERANQALAAYAAELLERAETLERENMPPTPTSPAQQLPAQQQQQIQPEKKEEEAAFTAG